MKTLFKLTIAALIILSILGGGWAVFGTNIKKGWERIFPAQTEIVQEIEE